MSAVAEPIFTPEDVRRARAAAAARQTSVVGALEEAAGLDAAACLGLGAAN